MKPARKPTITWEAQIDLPSSAMAPDSFSGPPGTVPPDNFVVARDRAGNPVSRYGELRWNLTAYHARQKPVNLHFAPWGKEGLSRGQRRIMNKMRKITFDLMYKRRGYPLSPSSLLSLVHALLHVARWSHVHGYEIEECFSDAVVLRELLQTHHSGSLKSELSGILASMIEIGEEELGFRPLGGKSLAELRAITKQYQDSTKQHAPLPPRIFTSFIANSLSELAEIDAVLDSFLDVVREVNRWLKENIKNRYLRRPTGETAVFRELLERRGLVSFFEARAYGLDRFGVMACIGDIQMVCRYVLHAFSGARREEILYLPYDCIEIRAEHGRVDYLLHGATTKLNYGLLKNTYWVTSEQGAYAVRIAQKVADVIYQQIGCHPGEEGRSGKYPLFVSQSYLPLSNAHWRVNPESGVIAVQATARVFLKLNARLLPCIESEDLMDLKIIDPHRAWSSEAKYKVGNRWPLVPHQLRRSLALYGSSSGLVTLPSLRRQLQHITDAMARYYARGSKLALDIINGDKEHFGLEYQAMQPESRALAYIAVALFSDESLFGAQGKSIERQKKTKDGLKILKDRDNTIKLFKKGQLSYKETMLGGCMEVGPCEKRALRSITGCIDCGKAILIPRKVHLVVAAQKARVATLDRNTVEYRQESHDLKILTATLKKMEGARQ